MTPVGQDHRTSSVKVDISYKTFLFGLFLFFALKFITSILDLLVLIYVAFLFALAVDPLVVLLRRLRLSRPLAVLVSFVIALALASGFLAVVVPPLIDQTQRLLASLPVLMANLPWEWQRLDVNQLGFLVDKFSDLPLNVVKTALGLIGNIFSLLTIIVMAFYISVEKPFLPRYLTRLLGKNHFSDQTVRFLDLVDKQLSRWLVGELILMLLVGLFSYLGLVLLKIPYALPLAMLAGLLEIVPNLGPIASAIPPALIGFSISPLTGAAVIGWYFLVQQVENSVLVPKVIGSAVGVHPFLILITLLIGFKLGGVGGALLSVPILVTIKVAIRVYLLNQKGGQHES